MAQAVRIKQVLQLFQAGTGQLLSPSKCSLLPRESLDPAVQEQIRRELEVERVRFDAKYLGLFTPDGALKKECFLPIKERFIKRVTAWSEKYLSSGGKGVLIKLVAQAILTYVMSVFHLSDTLCDELTRVVRKYWWGESDDQRKSTLDCMEEVHSL